MTNGGTAAVGTVTRSFVSDQPLTVRLSSNDGTEATVPAIVVIPVAVLATVVVMLAAKLTFNLMTLGGIAAAIGLIIDDAIVVVEAVEHHLEEGLTARAATLKAMEEVGGPVVAIAIILANPSCSGVTRRNP